MSSALNGIVREERFRSIMLKRGVTLERCQRRFRFKRTTYLPDFYDPATDTYYEVTGSRQRAATLAPTLDLMDLAYPDVRIEVVLPDGTPTPKSKPVHRHDSVTSWPFGEGLLRRMESERLLWRQVARAIGISQSTLSNYLSRRHPMSPRAYAALVDFAAGATAGRRHGATA